MSSQPPTIGRPSMGERPAWSDFRFSLAWTEPTEDDRQTHPNGIQITRLEVHRSHRPQQLRQHQAHLHRSPPCGVRHAHGVYLTWRSGYSTYRVYHSRETLARSPRSPSDHRYQPPHPRCTTHKRLPVRHAANTPAVSHREHARTCQLLMVPHQ